MKYIKDTKLRTVAILVSLGVLASLGGCSRISTMFGLGGSDSAEAAPPPPGTFPYQDLRISMTDDGLMYHTPGSTTSYFSGIVSGVPMYDVNMNVYAANISKGTEYKLTDIRPKMTKQQAFYRSLNKKYDGKNVCDVKFENGVKDGKTVCYYNRDADKIALTADYKKGKLEGSMKTMFQDGRIAGEAQFSNGEPNGRYVMYRPEPYTLAQEYKFSKGLNNGEFKFYEEDGTTLRSSCTFKQGKIEGTVVLKDKLADGSEVNGKYEFENDEIKSGELTRVLTENGDGFGKVSINKYVFKNGLLESNTVSQKTMYDEAHDSLVLDHLASYSPNGNIVSYQNFVYHSAFPENQLVKDGEEYFLWTKKDKDGRYDAAKVILTWAQGGFRDATLTMGKSDEEPKVDFVGTTDVKFAVRSDPLPQGEQNEDGTKTKDYFLINEGKFYLDVLMNPGENPVRVNFDVQGYKIIKAVDDMGNPMEGKDVVVDDDGTKAPLNIISASKLLFKRFAPVILDQKSKVLDYKGRDILPWDCLIAGPDDLYYLYGPDFDGFFVKQIKDEDIVDDPKKK